VTGREQRLLPREDLRALDQLLELREPEALHRVFLISALAERSLIVRPAQTWRRFNLVDATYRFDLRELNELNFARFDAKLEQRVAELRADMEGRFARFDAKFEHSIAALDANIDLRLAKMETRLTKRMFGFWIAQAATTAALVLGVVKLVGS
jgi:hypothetical protein